MVQTLPPSVVLLNSQCPQSSGTAAYEVGYLLPKASVFTVEIYRG